MRKLARLVLAGAMALVPLRAVHAQTACSYGLKELYDGLHQKLDGASRAGRQLGELLADDGKFMDLGSGAYLDKSALLRESGKMKSVLFPDDKSYRLLAGYVGASRKAKALAPNERVYVQGHKSYRYTTSQPAPANGCVAGIRINVTTRVDKEFENAESTYMYFFSYTGGQIRLIENNSAG